MTADASIGDLLAAAMAAAGQRPRIMCGRFYCETDMLAALGKTFPKVPYEELVRFNRQTLHEVMDEDLEFERYRRIACFFRGGGGRDTGTKRSQAAQRP